MSDRPEDRAPDRPGKDIRGRSELPAPAYEALPTPKGRTARSGPTMSELSVRVEVVTPILGGGTQNRRIDEVEVIRAATVRGHLRVWWRALYAHQYQSPGELYASESELWGRAATDEGGRSAIDIRIHIEQAGELDSGDIQLYDSRDAKETPGAYALWPARAESRKKTPLAPRRKPGTQFRLTLIAPAGREAEVRSVVRAWLLFGGYGSRTRRGLGSFRVINDPSEWLPPTASREAITALFGTDVFARPGQPVIDVPRLGGAALQVGQTEGEPMKAWVTALDWLKEFRQGTRGQPGGRAREPGNGKAQPQRPSISNWPEADKIRHLSQPRNGLRWAHQPRHNAIPVWPRAGFGLPIIGQFQVKSRQKDQRGKNLHWDELPASDPNHGTEPSGTFELRWRSGHEEHDRLASPLIVKALPLAGGRFVPCVLWLARAYPAGEVVLSGVNDSAAPFDRLVAAGDAPRFSPLASEQGLREAFLDWLRAKYQTMVVAP
jgi:CRISPR-associated protein Cmr1